MKRTLLIITCLITTTWAIAQSNQPVRKATVAYAQINGVNPNLLSLDIYYNPGGTQQRKPVVVYVHGGGWKGGDKNNTALKDELFTQNGYVFVSVNYRLSPPCPPCDTRSGSNAIRFPIHPKDVAKAIRWVHDNIAQYGGNRQSLFLLGHSAGAHLVGLVSTNQAFLEDEGLSLSNIKCTCSLDIGIFDLPKEMREANFTRRLLLENAFGPNPSRWAAASPQLNVSRGEAIPPFFFVHRTANRSEHQDFISVLRANGHEATRYNASPFTHAQINQRLGDYQRGAQMTNRVMSFYENCQQNTRIKIGAVEKQNVWVAGVGIGQVYIHGNPETEYIMEVKDLQGIQIYQGRVKSQQQVAIGNKASGLYIITLRNTKTGQIHTSKIVQ